jgi:segregation and condensation protein B
MPDLTLAHQLEAILFVAAEPLSTQRLAAAVNQPPAAVDQALAELAVKLQGGIRLSQLHGRHQLVSAPDAASLVRQFLQDESKIELSRPALETLAIVAYRGPLTKTAIETIRGVSSDVMVRNLLARGLITESGRSSEPGRPLLYTISHEFLQHFGLTSTQDLPAIPPAETKEPAPHES